MFVESLVFKIDVFPDPLYDYHMQSVPLCTSLSRGQIVQHKEE